MNSATEKLSVLVIGVGSIGERHVRCFQTTGLWDVTACEPNAALAETIGGRYNCPYFTDLEVALEQGKYDAAVICTPAQTHIPIARTCVRRGLHVLIEKPLALQLDGIAELGVEAAVADRVIRVAYVTRAHETFIAMKALLEKGIVGQPRQVSVVAGQHFPTFRPAYREIYYAKHESGGGAIQDALTHQVHTVEWLVAPIARIFAYAEHQVLEGVEVEDSVNASGMLADGTMVGFSYNQFQAPNESSITVHGVQGSIRGELHNRRVGIMLAGETEWKWTDFAIGDRDTIFIAQARYFHDAVLGKPSPLSSLAEATQTLKVNRAMLESARTRREVVIEG